MSDLGEMKRVYDIRTYWRDKARDFTPWLAQDTVMASLAEAIGMRPDGLELVGRPEQAVGGFRADIVCRETAPPGRTVIIENQFGTTDHDHLGKLLTYAAGKEATILIWIAEVIREEHEAALDMLNAMSSDDFQVFGVELELYRIGDSPAAPRFNIVSKPNDWKRHERFRKRMDVDAKSLTPTQVMQFEYWTAVAQALATASAPFNPVSAQPVGWVTHGIGKSNVGLNFNISTRDNTLRLEIYLSGETAKGYLAQLEADKDAIQEELGYALDWQHLEDKTDARICITRDANLHDREDWPAQHSWLVTHAIAFHRVFHDRVRGLDRDIALLVG